MRHTSRAIIIRDKKLLLVTGHSKDYYWTPGGGVEENETILEALHREIREELGTSVLSAVHYMSYILEDTQQKADNFIVEIEGDFYLDNEITDSIWLSKEDFINKRINVSKGLNEKVLPALFSQGLL